MAEKRTILRLSAGQIDAALSAVATFLIGIYAVRSFDVTLLGAYVIIFTAWNLARTIPSEMILTPSEVVAISYPVNGRIRIIESSVPRGIAIALPGGAAVLASTALIIGDVGTVAGLALGSTGAAVAVLGPIQQHWRRLFHICESSWRAVAVSIVNLAVTIAGLTAIERYAESYWVPFGALALGLACSVLGAAGLSIPLRRRAQEGMTRPALRELTSIGGWLLPANLAGFGSDFLVALIAKLTVGAEILGFAEGARVVTRPIAILGLGLAAVLGPRSITAGAERDVAEAIRLRRLFWKLSSVAGFLYLLIAAWDWSLNPIFDLLPNAYHVDGLVLISGLGVMAVNLALPFTNELLGGRRQRDIAGSALYESIVKVLVGIAAPILQAFTLPLAWTAGVSARAARLARDTRRMFGGNADSGRSLTP